MSAAAIATIILVGIIVLAMMVAIPEFLTVVTLFSLIGGFYGILVGTAFVTEPTNISWLLFTAIIWELFWVGIAHTPTQKKIWTQPLSKNK